MEFDGENVWRPRKNGKSKKKRCGNNFIRYFGKKDVSIDNSATEEDDTSQCDSKESFSGVSLNESIDIKTGTVGSMQNIGHEARSNRMFDAFGGNRPFSRSSSEANFGNASRSAQKRPIPTAYELFNIGRPRSEFDDGQSNGIKNNGFGSKSKAMMGRSSSMSRVLTLPVNFVKCRYCFNIMHKDYMNGHMERKHKQDVEHHRHVRAITKKIVNGSTAAADDNAKFINCTFCSALMHNDYMASHLVRKHKAQNGAIGVTWDYSDDEIREFLNANVILVKDGVLYVNEFDVVN